VQDFTFTDEPQSHSARRREILSSHPEIRALGGPHWSTPIAIFAVAAAQLALAWLVGGIGFWWAILAAYLVGAFFSHALYVLIHECTHNLAARGQAMNRALGIACDLPLGIPSATVFRTYHLLHHRHLGELEMDPDIVSRREAELVGSSRWRKVVWLALFSLSQALRPLKVPGGDVPRSWLVANLVVVFAVDAAVAVLWGPAALAYLVCSMLFALGLHPLGGRWLQEHYVTSPGQETYSYYGPLNWVAFNIGYHNEHHDCIHVPWIHLPRVRRIAAPFYDGLKSYRSWTAVVLRFVLDRGLSPCSRIVHPDTRQARAPDSAPAAS
jgi:sphingolipid delta-4 desaturase